VHFPCDERSRDEITDFLVGRSPKLRLTLLESVRALTDTPISLTYQELDRAYPGSRFILTIRSRGSWLASCQAYWHNVLQPNLERADPDMAAYVRLVNRALYGTDVFDATRFAAVYDEHHRRAREYFASRTGDCLWFDICAGNGWECLCEFLDVPPPAEPFPRDNVRPVVPLAPIHSEPSPG
jgi:hypothetical protein